MAGAVGFAAADQGWGGWCRADLPATGLGQREQGRPTPPQHDVRAAHPEASHGTDAYRTGSPKLEHTACRPMLRRGAGTATTRAGQAPSVSRPGCEGPRLIVLYFKARELCAATSFKRLRADAYVPPWWPAGERGDVDVLGCCDLGEGDVLGVAGAVSVACHEHGTTLKGFLPRVWALARIL